MRQIAMLHAGLCDILTCDTGINTVPSWQRHHAGSYNVTQCQMSQSQRHSAAGCYAVLVTTQCRCYQSGVASDTVLPVTVTAAPVPMLSDDPPLSTCQIIPIAIHNNADYTVSQTVSYTHLTLPTKRIV